MRARTEPKKPAERASGGACLHCGAACPGGAEFCCRGCEAVHAALVGGGLEDYYRVRAQDPKVEGGQTAPAQLVLDADFAYLDTEPYRRGHTTKLGPPAGTAKPLEKREAVWTVDGITCVACVWLIEKLAGSHPGVEEARVDLLRRTLRLRFSGDARLSALAHELGRFGYRVGLGTRPDVEQARFRKDLVHVAVAGAAAANAMVLSLPYYMGLEGGRYAFFFGWLLFALATGVLVGPGRSFFRNARLALGRRLVSLDLPVALGLLAAYLGSTVELVQGRPQHLYFDSLAVLVFALLIGRFAQSRAVARALAAAGRLAASMPALVRAWRQGAWVRIAPEEVAAGDRLRLDAGERSPCDAEMQSEAGSFDLSVVTGEEAPRRLERGQPVPAGARALEDGAEVIALAIAQTTRAEALRRRAASIGARTRQIPMLADRLGVGFTGVVVAIAAIAAVWWGVTGGVETAARVGMTVLVVACPCALGLATPVVGALAVARAARGGIVVRAPEVLERLGAVRTVLLDKTGTLTAGRPTVTWERWFAAPGDRDALAKALAAVESSAWHPVGRAVAARLSGRGEAAGTEAEVTAATATPDRPPTGVVVEPGEGVEGTACGWRVFAGSPQAAARRLGGTPPEIEAACERVREQGATVVVACGRRASAPTAPTAPWRAALVLGVVDALRPGARELVGRLEGAHRVKTQLVSGDHARAVERVARASGIARWRADLQPVDKLRIVAEAQAGGDAVAMVGDGWNDVAALTGSSLAVTLGTAVPQAIAASEVILLEGGVRGLWEVMDLAARARVVIVRNLLAALGYNAVGIGLAVAGLISPLLAAVLMPLSSLTVVGHSIWAMRRMGRTPGGR